MAATEQSIGIVGPGVILDGILRVPEQATGLVLFAHGSGSGRLSPRNQFVAQVLNEAGLATLLLDLLTSDEECDSRLVFDLELLSQRLALAASWASDDAELGDLPMGLFGASTGAAAALIAAARDPGMARAVVSRGGRPDLAGSALSRVAVPTLLIVGGDDSDVLELNRRAMVRMACHVRLEVVPGATHLFPEPGAMEEVAAMAREWFLRFLRDPRENGP